ncbi:MAG: hypothetical protein MUC92_00970 [Fimbriimonadaceae bacterium]|nr:hypothetical protein [Fimbriimonadaceae bacterium]
MMAKPNRLELTEEEAFALLNLAMLSELPMDSIAERAVRKLADHCKSNHTIQAIVPGNRELCEAG